MAAAAAGLAGAVLVLLGGFPLISSGEPPAEATGHPVEYVVQPGDTLWGIVVRLYPHGDPRPLVDQLSAEFHGRALQVGQAIEVP